MKKMPHFIESGVSHYTTYIFFAFPKSHRRNGTRDEEEHLDRTYEKQIFLYFLREAAKKVLFLVDMSTKTGGGLRAWPIRKEELFLKLFFVAVEKLKIFCLRRHVEILILVY